VLRIRTAFQIASQLLEDPRRLGRVIDPDRLKQREAVQRFFDRPGGLLQIDLLDLLPGLDETVSPYSFLEGQASPVDIALLKGLARQRPGCRYLEIGCWRGESLANLASVAAECVCVTLSAEEMREAGYPEAAIRCEGFFSRDLPNVRLVPHNSRTLNFGQFAPGFDLIFIDGDHSVEAIRNDTRAAFSVLRNEESVIVWHDYGITEELVNRKTLEGIRQGCTAEQFKRVFHVSNTLCAAFLNGRPIEGRREPFPQNPDKTFNIRLTAKRFP
jgi:hypothetical protein